MDDFFNQFRENLNRRPEPDFEENDWRDLEKRLAPADTKRSVLPVFWWWVAAPALLCSLGANGLFFNKLQMAKQEIAVLENQRDTIYLTRIENHTDTIYRTKRVRERVIEYVPAAFANRFQHGTTIGLSGKKDLSEQTSPNIMAAVESKPIPINPQAQTSMAKSNSLSEKSPTPENFAMLVPPTNSSEQQPHVANLALLETPLMPIAFTRNSLDIKPQLVPIAAHKHKKTLPQILYPMRPRDFSVGVSGGALFPFDKGLNRGHGWSLGMEASVGFSPQLRLWAEGVYQQTGFLSNRMDDALGIPLVLPPSDDFVFVNAETLQPMLQFGLGMQYGFNPKGIWRPFVGVGYGAVSILPYQVAYEFNNQQLNVQWDFDQRVNRRELLPGFLLLRAGMERPLTKRLDWNFMVSYRNNFGNSVFSAPPNLGLQMGLRF